MSLPLIQPTPAGPALARRAVLARRVRLLVAVTITYTVIEGVVAIAAGTVASSTALIGFGLDSFIEVASAAAVAWLVGLPLTAAYQLGGGASSLTKGATWSALPARRPRRERRQGVSKSKRR